MTNARKRLGQLKRLTGLLSSELPETEEVKDALEDLEDVHHRLSTAVDNAEEDLGVEA